jgi:hypothetical protein
MRDDTRTRLATLGVVLVALVVVLLVLSPVLLFGTRLSGADLLLLAAGVFGIGLLGRWRGSGAVRQLIYPLVEVDDRTDLHKGVYQIP